MMRRNVDKALKSSSRLYGSRRTKSYAAEHPAPTTPIITEGSEGARPKARQQPLRDYKIADAHDNDYNATPKVVVVKPVGYNFGGGPGAIREIVRQHAAREMLEGGLLEVSHREPGAVHACLNSMVGLVRDLLKVPEDYEILLTHGGAHAQFAAVPLNFGENPSSVSCITGSWSAKSSSEQQKFAKVTEYDARNETSWDKVMPGLSNRIQRDTDYAYMCSNETMQGIQFVNDSLVPSATKMVCDATSDLFSRQMDISKYGVVFASGGKNLGPAGFAVMIVRKDIIEKQKASSKLPSILSWKEFAQSKPIPNIYNTPAMLSIGLSKLVLEDVAKRGGMEWAERRGSILSQELYREIDSSNGFYANQIPKDFRSRVSVVFGIPGNKALESTFVKTAESIGLLQLVNHPSVGGMRASLYNAMPVKAVEKLVTFMREFKRHHDV